jgi:PAS domain S-box-containing protein
MNAHHAERYRHLLEVAPDAMVVVNAQGRIVAVNTLLERLFGYTWEELRNQPVEILLPERFRDRHSSLCAGYMAAPQVRPMGVGRTLAGVRKNRQDFPVEISLRPVATDDGTLVIGTIRDISDRLAAQAERDALLTELQRANAELRQFAAIVSHDLHEPLRTMQFGIEQIAQKTSDTLDPELTEDMAHVVDAAHHMQQLLTDLLAYTRLGRAPVCTRVDCAALLARVLSTLQAQVTERNALITADPLPTIQGDATRLEHVLQNLISNALKFCRTQPRVHIAAVKEPQHWRFAVRDNGIGIDPPHLERIFQVFQRLHTHREYTGAGMGLAICKRIVEQHGGRIWVESQPGAGGTFYFTVSDVHAGDKELRGGVAPAI